MKIIFVGRLIQAKGVQDLIKAFNLLSDLPLTYQHGLELWIIGDGNYRKQLEKLASKNEKIKFYGELSHDKVIEKLKQANIFVNPSYSEGLPTTVLEAASVGLPIIATNAGGTNEIIQHINSGYISANGREPIYKALIFMITNRKEAKEMGKRAKLTTETKFDWDVITQQYMSVLRRFDISTAQYME
jgi:glycosyltransferase involved in cell wall biosynthesis